MTVTTLNMTALATGSRQGIQNVPVAVAEKNACWQNGNDRPEHQSHCGVTIVEFADEWQEHSAEPPLCMSLQV